MGNATTIGFIPLPTAKRVDAKHGNPADNPYRKDLLECFAKAHPNARMELIRQNVEWFRRHLDEIMEVIG